MTQQMPRETELLKACLAGNTAAFETIIERYQSFICAITFSATGSVEKSEELAQETFIKAWTSLAQLNDLGKFRSWLTTIARNIIRNSFRSQKRDIISKAASLDLVEDAKLDISEPSEAAITKERQAVVQQALQRIPPKYRDPLVLFYRHDQSIGEVAAQLELSYGAVKTRLSRGRKMLKKQVAAMVESTISSTGPTKAFTTAVTASIAALAVKGSGIAAAGIAATTSTAATSATVATIMSGITAKIIAAAAVIAIGVGATVAYKNLQKEEIAPKPSITQTSIIPQQEIADDDTIPAPAIEITEQKTITAQTPQVAEKQPTPEPPIQQTSLPDKTSAQSDNVETKAKESEPFIGVSGIVIDKTTSKPIADVEVYMSTPKGKKSIKTDPDGKFEFNMNVADIQGVPDQFEYRLNIIAKTYITRRVSVHLKKNEISDCGKIELTPGTKIAGTVFNQNDEPIEGAKVATFQFTNHPAITDADGNFEIDGLDPSWASYSLHSEHPDYPSAKIEFSPIKAGETLYKEIVMTKGITVHGQVTDTNGKPIRGVNIGNTTSGAMWNVIEDKTDAQGSYTLKNVPPGELVIWAINNKYAPYVENFTLDTNSKEKQIDIQLLDPVPLHGEAVDALGNSVPDVLVCISEYKGVRNLSNHRVKTDSQGLFTIPNAPPEGKLTLSLFGSHVPNVQPELEMGQDFYTITVDRAGKIYGKVFAKETRLPITNFTVKMTFSEVAESKDGYAATWSRQGHTFSSNEGYFDTGRENLAIGANYALTVFAEGFEPLMIDPVTVQAVSNTPERTEFGLIPATMIKGTVTDIDGEAIAGARLRWIAVDTDSEHWDDRDTAVTDTKGQFVVSSIGDSALAMYVTAMEFSPVLFTVDELPYNDDGVLGFELEDAPRLYGIVTDLDGNPIAGANISVSPELNRKLEKSWVIGPPQTATDIDGFYEIFDLPTGKASINVRQSDNTYIKGESVTLQAGQEMELNISEVRKFSISGTIPYEVKDTENISIRTYIHKPKNLPDHDWGLCYYDIKINHEGSFTCKNFKEGKYFLYLTNADGYNSVTDIFELTDDIKLENLTFNPSTNSLAIRAVDSQTGKDIPYTNFRLLNDLDCQFHSKKLLSPEYHAMDTGPSAEAIFDSLPAGRYMIRALATGYLTDESEYVELLDNETKPITIQLTPSPTARFKLSQETIDNFGTDKAYMKCTVTDNTTGQIVPRTGAIFVFKDIHFIHMTDSTNSRWFATSLNLPSGSYTIDYSLHLYVEKNLNYQQKPIKTGTETIELSTGQTTIIEMTIDSP